MTYCSMEEKKIWYFVYFLFIHTIGNVINKQIKLQLIQVELFPPFLQNPKCPRFLIPTAEVIIPQAHAVIADNDVVAVITIWPLKI